MDRAHPDRKLYYTGLARLRYPVQCLLTALWTAFWGSCSLVISLFDRRGRWIHACAHNWGAWILQTCRVKVDIEGLEHLEAGASYVVMANHKSLFDIPTMLTSLPFPFRMLAKASLFRIPFMGWYMSRVGYIPVEREDPKQARSSLEEAAKRVASGLSVVIFPEGTRQPEGKIARFKRGGMNLAHAAGVPVVPVAILNSGRLLPRGSWHADPGVIRVKIGQPLDPGEFTEPRALADAIRAAVIAMTEERCEAA